MRRLAALAPFRLPGRALTVCACVAAAGLLAFAPAGALYLLLAASVIAAILAYPAAGLALCVGSVPFAGLWSLPVGPGNLTWTPLLLGVTTVAWLAQGAFRGRLVAMARLSRQPVLWALTAYLGVVLASAWRAPSLPAALFELARWLEWGLACLLAADLAKRQPARYLLLSALLITGVAAAIAAIAPRPTIVARTPFLAVGTPYGRAYGTFGQPNPFAAFMNTVWPIGAALLLLPILRKDRSPGRNDGPDDGSWLTGRRAANDGAMVFWAAGAATFIVCIVGLLRSWSRGGWLAAAAAAAVMALLIAGRAFRRPWSGRQLGALWLVGVTVLLALFVGPVAPLPGAVVERLASVSLSPGLTAVADAEIDDANFATIERLAHWQAALAMWSEKPWLGQGPGHFELAYARFRLGRWPDPLGHAHNYYLHALAESGLFGLAAFLALLGSAWWAAAQAAWRSRSPLPAAVSLGVAGVISAVAVHSLVDNVFVHEMTVTLGALTGLLLAVAEA